MNDTALSTRKANPQRFDSIDALLDFKDQPALQSASVVIDQDTISRFAQVTQDTQWIHTDPARAHAESPYGTTIAHGFLVMSLLSYWQSTCIAFPKARMLLNYGFDKIRFTAAVLSGASVSASFALTEVTQIRPGEARCKWNVKVCLDDTQQVAIYADWLIMVRFDEAESASAS